MWELFLARLGSRTCPWCRPYEEDTNLAERFMVWLTSKKLLLGYDYWVGTHGLKIHAKHGENQ